MAALQVYEWLADEQTNKLVYWPLCWQIWCPFKVHFIGDQVTLVVVQV